LHKLAPQIEKVQGKLGLLYGSNSFPSTFCLIKNRFR